MEAEKVKHQPGNQNRLIMLLLGLLLLVPALKIGYDTRLGPALQVAGISFTKYNLMQDPKYIGIENYARLGEDAVLRQSLSYGFTLVMTRLFILAIVPAVVGLLAGAGNLLARSLNRIVLSVIFSLSIPVALALVWRMYWGQMWGMEPSPIFDPAHSFGTPDGARDLLTLLDGLILLGTGGAAGITVFMAVMRGEGMTRSIAKTGLVAWLLVMLFGLLSITQVFVLPYLITAGGPANSTMTPGLVYFRQAFQNFNMGYAAAIATMLLVGVIIVVVLAWLVLELSRLRLTTVASSGGNATGFIALPLLLLMAFPLVSLLLWANNLGAAFPERSGTELLQDASVYSTVTQPWLAIWLIQLPVTWLAGFALGFLRPGGRIGSALLFLVLLLIAAIPDETVNIAWLINAREAGILNSFAALAIPWKISVFPLLAFKLFFDGAYEKYQAAVQSGAQPQNTLISRVILPSLAIALVAGAVLSFQSAQDLSWSLLAINSPELMPLSLKLVQLQGMYSVDFGMIATGAMRLITQLAVVFIPVFAILNLFVMDRLALVTGPSSTVKNETLAAESDMA